MTDRPLLEEGGGSQFSRSTKLDDRQILRLVYFFCHGLPVEAAARGANVTAKTVREYYVALRVRLVRKGFTRWHRANVQTPSLSPEIVAALVRPAFFDLMAECHANAKCAQNFRLGYRARRLCRACPLTNRFTSGERLDEALALIDVVRDFYGRLGLRSEKDCDPVSLFRLRLIHTVTVATALANSRTRRDGLKDPLEKSYLSVGTLLDLLLGDLAGDPL